MMSKSVLSRTGIYGIAIENEKVLLIKQETGPHCGKFDLPGGGIEPGETIEEALRREFCEEVGMHFESMQLIDNLTAVTEEVNENGIPYILHQVGLIYIISGLSMQKQPAELEYFWIHPDALKEMPIAPFVGQMILGHSGCKPSTFRKFHPCGINF